MMIKLYFSPFDTLGFDATATPLSRKELGRKRRKAAFHVHPDSFGSCHGLWPTGDDLNYAESILEKDWVGAFEKFKNYPRTFFPEKSRGSSDVFRNADQFGFYTCECRMPLQFNDKSAHLIDRHDYKKCQQCPEPVPRGQMKEHICIRPSEKCSLCPDVVEVSKKSHHQKISHYCTLCQGTIKDLRSHLHSVHELRFNEKYSLEEIHNFILDTTFWHCSCCSCVCLPNYIEVIRTHMESKHYLSPCLNCDFKSNGLNQHILQMHPMEACTECEQSIEAEYMRQHKMRDHDFRACKDCNEIFQSDGQLGEHVQKNHRRCPRCQQICVSQDQKLCGECDQLFHGACIQQHQFETHNYLRCTVPVCEVIGPATAMFSHTKTHVKQLQKQSSQEQSSQEQSSQKDYRAMGSIPVKGECCGRYYQNLRSHMSKAHPKQSSQEQSSQKDYRAMGSIPVKGDCCGRYYENLRAHISKKHPGSRVFKAKRAFCSRCKKSYAKTNSGRHKDCNGVNKRS